MTVESNSLKGLPLKKPKLTDKSQWGKIAKYQASFNLGEFYQLANKTERVTYIPALEGMV